MGILLISAGRGAAWCGTARPGGARRGRDTLLISAWRGLAWRGPAWRGEAWRGMARRGRDTLLIFGAAGRGVAWRGSAWHG